MPGEKIELPDTIQTSLMGLMIQQQQIAMGDLQLAFARQRDGAAYDMRVIGAISANELLVSNDPVQFAGLNTGIRTPTTISHPSVGGPSG